MSHLRIITRCANNHSVEHNAHPTARDPIGLIQQLAPTIAEAHQKVHAPCPQCGEPVRATFSRP
jgi:hypothetical protein